MIESPMNTTSLPPAFTRACFSAKRFCHQLFESLLCGWGFIEYCVKAIAAPAARPTTTIIKRFMFMSFSVVSNFNFKPSTFNFQLQTCHLILSITSM